MNYNKFPLGRRLLAIGVIAGAAAAAAACSPGEHNYTQAQATKAATAEITGEKTTYAQSYAPLEQEFGATCLAAVIKASKQDDAAYNENNRADGFNAQDAALSVAIPCAPLQAPDRVTLYKRIHNDLVPQLPDAYNFGGLDDGVMTAADWLSAQNDAVKQYLTERYYG